MERRIKIIWLLSLTSMLLIGAGQGYWLWSHYQYTNEAYGREVLRQVSEAVVSYNTLRWQEPRPLGEQKAVQWYNTNVNWDDRTDSLTGQESTRIYLVQRLGAEAQDTLTDFAPAQTGAAGVNVSRLLADSTVLCTDSVVLMGDKRQYERLNMMYLADLMRLELSHPFDLHPFDSIVAATLPDVTFSTRLSTTAADSLYQWEATLHSGGSLLRPLAQVVYPYNPLKRQLVEVDVRIPCHMLLLRMGGQLAGSLLMIALLAVCLLFQIKTILKQRRVDELRRSFVSTMIHELKRPVQTLKMCLAYLSDPSLRVDTKATDAVVDDSIVEVDNLSAYLQKLRDMTRADDERTPLSLRTFDFRPMAEKTLRQLHIPDHKPRDGRPHAPLQHPEQPAGECREVFGRLRPHHCHRYAGRASLHPRGGRQRHRHPARRAGPRVRQVLPQRQPARPLRARHRPGPELREAARGSAWRHRRPPQPTGAGDDGNRHYTSMRTL